MKFKFFIILGVSFFAIMVIGYFFIDTQLERNLSHLKLSKSNAGTSSEDSSTFSEVEELDDAITKPESKVSKPSRDFKFKVKKLNEFSYDEGRVFRWVNRDGKMQVIDDNSQRIVQLDPNTGIVEKVFGQKGGAPWENEGLVFYDVLMDADTFIVADNVKMAVSKRTFNNDKNIDYYKLEGGFWDASMLNYPSFIFLIEKGNENGDFEFVTKSLFSGDELNRVDFRRTLEIPQNEKFLNIAYEGMFLRNQLGKVVYLCSKAGLFLIFDEKGNVDKVSQTIDQSPPPKVEMKKIGNVSLYVKEPDISINYSATIDDEFLYVLSLIRFKKANNLVMDQYSLESGEYTGSIEIPNYGKQLPSEILMKSNKELSVLYEDMMIVNYELE